SSREEPSTTPRCSNPARDTPNDNATSTTDAPTTRCCSSNRAACARNASTDLPDTTHGTGSPAGAAGSCGTGA
ncbi:hypothetical protein, partial [Streptomyces sp. st77]|uniref:hypothetical protein n=1 Tax=Streptomyces sp. st77 TaxID=1828074 RepID=UPI001C54EC14